MNLFYNLFCARGKRKRISLRVSSLVILFILFALPGFSQSISIGTVTEGTYGRNSSITVPIKVDGCFNQNNKFELYLSDVNGNFVDPFPIGTYAGHYTTYVNGTTRPAQPAGTSYKIKVKSTSPSVETIYSGTIKIAAVLGPDLNVTPLDPGDLGMIPILKPNSIYGYCNSQRQEIAFKNASNSGHAISGVLKKETTPFSADKSINFADNITSEDIELDTSYYTASFQTVNTGNNTISTKSYLIFNAKISISFAVTDMGDKCADEDINFVLTADGPSGFKTNFPGMLYKINYGDGEFEVLTQCQLMKIDGTFKHTYKQSSCDKGQIFLPPNQTIQNVYVANVAAETNFFCNPNPSPAFAKVAKSPQPSFNSPDKGCKGSSITFLNTTTLGSTGDICNASANFVWSVNDVVMQDGDTPNFSYTFDQPGIYKITLQASNKKGTCAPKKWEKTVYIYEKPTADFSITKSDNCAPIDVIATNATLPKTSFDNLTYLWEVYNVDDPANPVLVNPTYINGTSSTSTNAAFRFTTPGNYKIRMYAKNDAPSTLSCSQDYKEIPVIVPGPIGVSLPPDKAYCRILPVLVDFANNPDHKVSYTGVQQNPGYKWEISGGTYSFVTGNDQSAFPQILFDELGPYIVKITYTSDCNTPKVATQVITFYVPIDKDAGDDDQVCYNPLGMTSYNLNAQPILSGQNGKWTLVSGPNTSASFSNDAAYNSTVTGLVPGTYVFRWTVSNPAGCAEFDEMTLVVLEPPAKPVISSPLTYCQNDVADPLIATASTDHTLTWYTKADFSDPSAVAPIPATSAPGTYFYYVTQTNSSGCSSDTSKIVVNVYPSIANNIIGEEGVVCHDSKPAPFGTKSGLTLGGGIGVYTYQWQKSEDNGTTWSDIPGAVSATYSAPNLTIETRYRRIVQSGKCSSISNEIRIRILPAIINNINTTMQTICEGDAPALLTAPSATGADGQFTYFWESSADATIWNLIPNSNVQEYQPGALTSTRYFRRGVQAACGRGPYSTFVIVAVNRKAKSDFSATSLKSCAPFNLATAGISVQAHTDRNQTFQWFANGVAIAPASASSTFPGYTIMGDNQTVEIKLVTTSRYGCNPDEKKIPFSTYPKINNASFSVDTDLGCGPLEVNFTNTSSPLTGIDFHWDFGNGQTSDEAQPGKIIYGASTSGSDTVYTAKLTVSTDCESFTIPQDITVRTKPKALFSPDITSGCSPLTVNFTNQSRGGNATYQFDFGDGTVINATGPVTSHHYSTTKVDTFTVKLVVTNECGIDETSYDIVVYPNALDAHLVVNGSQLNGCAPYTVTFDNNSTGANSFFWDFDDGSTAVSSTSPESKTHTFSSPGTYIVKLKAMNICTFQEVSQTIHVFEAPVASFSTNKDIYCVNESIQFNNLGVAAGASYIWDFGNGGIRTEASPVYFYNTPGKYTVKLTARQLVNGVICPKTVEKEIEIIALPVATFTSNESLLNCMPFKLTVASSLANAANIEWDFGDPQGDNNITSGLNQEHTYKQAGTYIIKVRAYNQLGCVETFQKPVTVVASPMAEFEGAEKQLCGTSATLSLSNKTSYTGTDLVNYEWWVDNQKVSVQKNLSNFFFSVPAGAALPYKMEVKLVAKSTIRACATTAIHYLYFNPVSKPIFTASTLASCAPFTVSIQNNSVNASIYKWYLNGQFISADRIPQIELTEPNKTYTLELETSNIYGCLVKSAPLTLTTYPKPTAVLELQSSYSCEGRFTINSLNATNKSTGATKYIWDFGEGRSPISTTASMVPFYEYKQPGEYIVTLRAINSFNCESVATQTINVYNTVTSAFYPNATNGCKSLTVTFTNLSENATEYIWDFGNGDIEYGQNPTKKFSYLNSPYQVKLIAKNGSCEDVSKEITINVTPPPDAFFNVLPDTTIKIPDYTFIFENKSDGDDLRFQWDFGDHSPFSEEKNPPPHAYRDIGKYTVKLRVTNENGCDSIYSRTVEIQNVPGYLYVPNAFEPGNEYAEVKEFLPKGKGLVEYNLKIFNRWGKLVWENSELDKNGSPAKGWDGKINNEDAIQGVYVWDIYAKFLDGTEWKGMEYENSRRKKNGPVHLIR